MDAMQQTRLLALAKTCTRTVSVFVMTLIMLLGMVTPFNYFVHLVHSFLRESKISPCQPFFSSHDSLYICHSSTVVGEKYVWGPHVLPKWLKIVFLVTGSSSSKRRLVNSYVSFCLSHAADWKYLAWIDDPVTSIVYRKPCLPQSLAGS